MAVAFSARWSDLLQEVVAHPGRMLAAYTAFHSYSVCNAAVAEAQCRARGIALGPLASFNTWKRRGRWVRKGESALWLWLPITVSGKGVGHVGADDDEVALVSHGRRTAFVWRAHWFVLAQTDGTPFDPPPVPGWDTAAALAALDVRQVPYDDLDGNVQGWARERTFALNPLAELPTKTTFHELGHIVLGHTSKVATDGGDRRQHEAEAECVALLCLDALGLNGADACRGYVQHWWGTRPLTDTSARAVMSAADRILRAGRKEAA